MTTDTSGVFNWGIRFTALVDGTLDGFDYSTQGAAGKVDVVNVTTSTNLLSQAHVAASLVNFSGLGINLVANNVYELLGSAAGGDNGRFGPSAFPVSNSDISVTTGVFSDIPFASWGSFNNIQTTAFAAAVPEPSTFAVLGMAGLAIMIGRRRTRREPQSSVIA
jgi:hypothetical protein